LSAPLIGVTGMWSNRVHGMRFHGSAVAVQVLRSIVRAGGEPLTLFAQSADSPEERVRRCDAIVVPGGADVRPETYGAQPHPETVPADYDGQDAFESAIMAAAIAERVPLLAICRGFQLLNVTFGGTLNQHIGDESNPHRNGLHDVLVSTSSRLHAAVGVESLQVSSYHHQAVDAVGAGLEVVGTAPDGVVEALEVPGAPVVAIQWHPEDDAETNPRQQALFDWVVREAHARMNQN
jgi:putative glutamine amidotransferase